MTNVVDLIQRVEDGRRADARGSLYEQAEVIEPELCRYRWEQRCVCVVWSNDVLQLAR